MFVHILDMSELLPSLGDPSTFSLCPFMYWEWKDFYPFIFLGDPSTLLTWMNFHTVGGSVHFVDLIEFLPSGGSIHSVDLIEFPPFGGFLHFGNFKNFHPLWVIRPLLWIWKIFTLWGVRLLCGRDRIFILWGVHPLWGLKEPSPSLGDLSTFVDLKNFHPLKGPSTLLTLRI